MDDLVFDASMICVWIFVGIAFLVFAIKLWSMIESYMEPDKPNFIERHIVAKGYEDENGFHYSDYE